MIAHAFAVLTYLAAGNAQVPNKTPLPYEILPVPPHADSLTARLQGKPSAVWLDGDILTILHRESGKELFVTGSIQLPMKKIEGTDLWIQRLRMKGWDKALISYTFFGSDTAVVAMTNQGIWRGRHAPKPAVEAAVLRGTIVDRTLHSAALGEDRQLTVYLPPNAPKRGLPAIFMADGRACRAYAKVLEPLILSHRVRPIAIVGVHSGGYRGNTNEPFDFAKDFRGKEYVLGTDPDRFKRHLTFFADEVRTYVEREFAISERREDHAVFGVSNGGGFAACAVLMRPDVFSMTLPMSHSQLPDERPPQRLPVHIRYVAGTLEPDFAEASAAAARLKSHGLDASVRAYVSGHDEVMWKLAFAQIVPTLFSSRSLR